MYFKTLNNGYKSPYMRAKWPVEGEWTDTRKPVVGASGWHVCPAIAFSIDYMADELWVAEIRGEVSEKLSIVSAEQARIIKQVPEWNEKTLYEFALVLADDVQQSVEFFGIYYFTDKVPNPWYRDIVNQTSADERFFLIRYLIEKSVLSYKHSFMYERKPMRFSDIEKETLKWRDAHFKNYFLSIGMEKEYFDDD